MCSSDLGLTLVNTAGWCISKLLREQKRHSGKRDSPANAGDTGDMDAILGLGKSAGGRHNDQRSLAGCNEEHGGMQRGAWQDAKRSMESQRGRHD